MRKKTLIILYVLGMLFTAGTVIAIIGVAAAVDASYTTCYDDYYGYSYRCQSSSQDVAIGFGIAAAILLGIVGSVLSLIAWIGVLIKQGQQEQWGWFVCTLLIAGIVPLIYLIAVPETPRYMVSSAPQAYIPVYPQPTVYPPPYPPPGDPYRPY